MKCETCKFWKPVDSGAEWGECRIRAPHSRHGWATVSVNAWCGEYKSAKKKEPTKRFVPPTIEEVQDHCSLGGLDVDAFAFWNFYHSKGWMVGKNKMKSWRGAVANWGRESNGTGKDSVSEFLK